MIMITTKNVLIWSDHHRKPNEMPEPSCCEAGSQLELEWSVVHFIRKKKKEREKGDQDQIYYWVKQIRVSWNQRRYSTSFQKVVYVYGHKCFLNFTVQQLNLNALYVANTVQVWMTKRRQNSWSSCLFHYWSSSLFLSLSLNDADDAT